MDVDAMIALAGVYAVVAISFVIPPPALIASGITVQGIFSERLGNENTDFVRYHLKRTGLTVVCHGALLIGFVAIMALAKWDIVLYAFGLRTNTVRQFGELVWMYHLSSPATTAHVSCVYVGAALAVVGTVMVVVGLRWMRADFAHHPTMKALRSFRAPSWGSVAAGINREFRSFEKIMVGVGNTRLIVTENWILKCTAYRFDVAHQSDCDLSIVDSIQVRSQDASQRVDTDIQILSIQVTSANPAVRPFVVRIKASDYESLVDRLAVPVRNARRVIILQSVSDRFVAAIREIVRDNPVYRMRCAESDREAIESDSCVGCMAKKPDIKIHKTCGGSAHQCAECYCRPMWCLDCLTRWFASKQQQERPEEWLGGWSQCPTCRATFCAYDVCTVRWEFGESPSQTGAGL